MSIDNRSQSEKNDDAIEYDRTFNQKTGLPFKSSDHPVLLTAEQKAFLETITNDRLTADEVDELARLDDLLHRPRRMPHEL